VQLLAHVVLPEVKLKMKDITELERELQAYKKRKQKKSDGQTIEVLSEDATPQVVDVSNMEEVYDGNDYQVYWDQESGKFYCSEHGFISSVEDHMDAEHNDDVEDFEIEYFTQKLSKEFKARQEYVPDDVIKRMGKEDAKKRLTERAFEAQKLSAKKLDISVLNQLNSTVKRLEGFLTNQVDHCPICSQTTITALTKVDPVALTKVLDELSKGNNNLNIKSINDLDKLSFDGKIGGQSAKISVLPLTHIALSHRSLLSHWSQSKAIEGKCVDFLLGEEVKLSKDTGYQVSNKTFSISGENSNLLSWLRKKNQDTQKASRD